MAEYTVNQESELSSVAEKVATGLGDRPFVLWLRGDLGAGKTTFAGYLLRALGLDISEPVTSPTYTLLQDYQIGHRNFAHLDLYRMAAGDSLEEIGLFDTKPYHGYLVEWPERLAHRELSPNFTLDIERLEDSRRRVIFKRII